MGGETVVSIVADRDAVLQVAPPMMVATTMVAITVAGVVIGEALSTAVATGETVAIRVEDGRVVGRVSAEVLRAEDVPVIIVKPHL